jgi:hypothetical protein
MNFCTGTMFVEKLYFKVEPGTCLAERWAGGSQWVRENCRRELWSSWAAVG